ncbi:carbohydrate ABC transporter permease [Halanaerobium saccharolyticum]|uniref:carbohydrate ABC transporter permease n=1 Tax=Halanaerobium saccharolyticum TaxID=43595 RepID=UPI0015E732EF|nr:carbohydrate ABC transporter permease [Halanaerobium saccharolyticum]
MKDYILYLSYAVISMLFLFPLLWTLSISLKEISEIFSYPPKLLPETFKLDNYVQIINNSKILTFIYNSIKISFFTVVGTLAVTIPGAFAFSRFRFKFKKPILFGLLIFQMMSPLIIAIPLYNYFNMIGLLDTHLGIIFVYVAIQIPFTTWLLKGSIDSVPASIDDAARIDGCSNFQLLTRVLIPIILPGISTAIIFNAIQSWAQFIIPFILLDNLNLFPVSLGIYNYQASGEAITIHLTAAASIFATIPTIIMFILLQRFIVSALTAGAVKG